MNPESRIPAPLTDIRICDAVMRLLGDLKRGAVLDAPSGNGHVSCRLKELGFDVYALDINVPAVDSCGVKFTRSDLNLALPYPAGFFECVVSVEGIEHIKNGAFMVEEFSRVLKPGGALVLTTPNINSVASRIKFALFGSFSFFNSKIGSGPDRWMEQHQNPVWFPALEAVLERCGFKIEEIVSEDAEYGMFLSRAAWALDALNRRFNKAYNRSLQTTGLLFGKNLIVKARKGA